MTKRRVTFSALVTPTGSLQEDLSTILRYSIGLGGHIYPEVEMAVYFLTFMEPLLTG
jgi:hypothetical protein